VISVIIITKNRSTLQQAIDSVHNQTIQDIELIVEHCPDNLSCGEVAFYKNQAILKATGEWVAFLDDDDYWYPSFLEKCINQDADVVICNNQYQQYGPLGDIGAILAAKHSVSPGSCIVYNHKSLKDVNGLNHELDYDAPYELMVKLYMNGCKFQHIPEPLVYVEHQLQDNVGLVDIPIELKMQHRLDILNNHKFIKRNK
jgi:glycosyltransferase involved in cell wall biosynthesis